MNVYTILLMNGHPGVWQIGGLVENKVSIVVWSSIHFSNSDIRVAVQRRAAVSVAATR